MTSRSPLTLRTFATSCLLIPAAALVRFRADRSGHVAIIFGLTAMVLFGSVGAAVDYGRWMKANTQMQNALDSAVLAGGRSLQTTGDPNAAITTAQQYFDQMSTTMVQKGATRSFSILNNNTIISGRSVATISTPFLSALGVTSLAVNNSSQATIAVGSNAGTNIEVSMMLDITGSMAGSKIADLITSAQDLVDIVVWDDQSSFTSKIAIVPFAPAVNVGSYVSAVTGLPASMTTTSKSGKTTKTYPITCVRERTGTQAYTDADPTISGQYVSAYMGDSGTTAVNDTSNYSSTGTCSQPTASQAIQPLTSNKTTLKTLIGNLTAGGSTAGLLGTSWAWYLISPNWSKVWTGTSTPAPYSDLNLKNASGQPKLRKIVVLMTDGAYNMYLGNSYGDTSTQAQQIQANAVTVCTNMKAKGIEVYTVGFDLQGDQNAINTLSKCATDASHFFNAANNGTDLQAAFRDIALRISTLHISS